MSLTNLEWTKHVEYSGHTSYTCWPSYWFGVFGSSQKTGKCMGIIPTTMEGRFSLEVGGKRVYRGSLAACQKKGLDIVNAETDRLKATHVSF